MEGPATVARSKFFQQTFVPRRLKIVPVLGSEIQVFHHISAKSLELIQAGRPGNNDRGIALHAETDGCSNHIHGLVAKVRNAQNIWLSSYGIGDKIGRAHV